LKVDFVSLFAPWDYSHFVVDFAEGWFFFLMVEKKALCNLLLYPISLLF